MQLVDEDDDVGVLGQLLHDRLEAFLELTAVLRPGDDERNIERQDALVGEEVRNVAVDDLLRQAFDDRRLPNARLADQHGVVLRAPAQYLLDALDLEVASDQRIELILHRRFGQVPREFGEQRRFLDARQRRLLVQQRDDVLANGVQPHPLFHEDGCGDRTFFAKDAEQEVFGTDVVVQQTIGLFRRKLQHAFGLGAKRDFDGGRDFLAENRAPFDLLADALERQVRPRENPARESLPLADQPEEQVLGLDRNAAELAGLVAREEENPSRSFRVTFEHPVTYECGGCLPAL